MNDNPQNPTLFRRFTWLLIIAAVIGPVAIVGMYFASYTTHLVWLAATKAAPRQVEDFPAWLVIPAYSATIGLVCLTFWILRRLGLLQKLGRPVQKQ